MLRLSVRNSRRMLAPLIHRRIATFGGIASLPEMALSPADERALRRAHVRGDVLRPRLGIYALQSSPSDVRRAAMIGGRVAGLSALHHYGLWVPDPVMAPNVRRLHVEVSGSRRVILEDASGERPVVLWSRAITGRTLGVAPLDVVLGQCARLLPAPLSVAVLDSALRRTPLTPFDLQFLAQEWSSRECAVTALVDERSESGTESILRVLLAEAGVVATPQPPIPTGEHDRADLLVGDRLLIECDSEAHHADPASRRADLARDLHLQALGFRVIRVDYRQLRDNPAAVMNLILAVIDRGEHLRAESRR